MTKDDTMLRRLTFTVAAVALVAAVTTGCTTTTPSPATSAAPAPSTAATPTTTAPTEPSTAAPAPDAATIVRFTSDRTTVDVTIGERTPAVESFLEMLPLTLPVEEFNGREKIAYLPEALTIEGTPGSDPENGDLIYFTPWGNLGFYYNTDGIGYSDSTLHLGTYDATEEQLALLEGGNVTIAVVD